MDIVLGIILIVASVFLVIAVLMQSSKSHRLSGAIAGGAETFFGKTKGSTIDKKLSKLTTIVAVVFVILVVVVYLLQDTQNFSDADLLNPDTENTGDVVDGTDTGDDTDGADTSAADDSSAADDTSAGAEDTDGAADTSADTEDTADANDSAEG